MNAIRSLMASLIDYAGLFPPLRFPMAHAVANYLRYRSSPEAWMLARFIVPVARLDEFEEAMAGQSPVPVSALAGPDLDHELKRIASASMKIDTIEIKAPDDAAIDSAMERVGGRYIAYFEISDPERIGTIRKKGGRVKIRMGGVTPEAFPSAEQAARLLETLGQTGTPFKATAGLHHPLRCYRPLTYSADGPSGWMFGFLNVFLAAALARKGVPAGETGACSARNP